MPSSFDLEAMEEMGAMWPTGGADYEVNTTESNSKVMQWNKLDEATRDKFREAAADQWQKWLENEAIKVLTPAESAAARQELQRKGESERILTPKFVLTDKNQPLRTPDNPLPLRANARLIVQGFRDLANLRGELRKDSPTASRIAQWLLCSISSHHKAW